MRLDGACSNLRQWKITGDGTRWILNSLPTQIFLGFAEEAEERGKAHHPAAELKTQGKGEQSAESPWEGFTGAGGLWCSRITPSRSCFPGVGILSIPFCITSGADVMIFGSGAHTEIRAALGPLYL